MSEPVGVDMFDFATFDVENQNAVVGIRERQMLAVGRPCWNKEERRFRDFNPASVLTVLIGDHQTVLATVVIEPRNLLTVR